MPFPLLAQVGFPYCETFDSNTTKSTTVFGADAQLVDGALRLTGNTLNQRGYVYIDIPFSSAYGIKASFEYFSYGGDGADGMTFFLFDANVPNFAIGGFGGSLGYSKRDTEPGLAGAYMGVGFDEYGNFGSTAEGKSGGFPGAGPNLTPNAIVIRGPGNGFTGYDFIKGKKTMESGPDGLASDQFFPISSGGIGTQRVTDYNKPGYRKVNLTLNPSPSGVGYLISMVMEYTVEENIPRSITIFQDVPYPYPAPANLKLGFSASTGGLTNFHEIRNLLVEVANDEDLLNPVGSDIEDLEACIGIENQFQITEEDVELLNENSTFTCLQFFKSLEEIEELSEDACERSQCNPDNQSLTVEGGIISATEEPGGFTFFPNEDFLGKEVTVYYTVTDNYGKSSQGNALTLKVLESPEAMELVKAEGGEMVEEISLCGGETVTLKGIQNVDYEKVEWQKDGVLIPGANQIEYTVTQLGTYTVLGYNQNGCYSISNEIKVTYPEPPSYDLENPLISCDPNQEVDLLSSLGGYDLENYDYLLTGEGQSYMNEELFDVQTSGSFELMVKLKSLDCYSDPVPVQIVILEEELVADFEFSVVGSGITGDDDGGIFPDDPIQFEDLSIESAESWFWEFGDGNSSTEQNPVHTYGKKGDFDISLTIEDEYGCSKTISKELRITRSYRVMFPTGFTPLENQNNTFLPKHKGIVSMELFVFNTWGELLFQTDDINSDGWDGKLKGQLLDAGVYVYRWNGIATDGDEVTEAGKFRLIR